MLDILSPSSCTWSGPLSSRVGLPGVLFNACLGPWCMLVCAVRPVSQHNEAIWAAVGSALWSGGFGSFGFIFFADAQKGFRTDGTEQVAGMEVWGADCISISPMVQDA